MIGVHGADAIEGGTWRTAAPPTCSDTAVAALRSGMATRLSIAINE